jgi:hypothetical protein
MEREVEKKPLPVDLGEGPVYNPKTKPPRPPFKKKFVKRR